MLHRFLILEQFRFSYRLDSKVLANFIAFLWGHKNCAYINCGRNDRLCWWIRFCFYSTSGPRVYFSTPYYSNHAKKFDGSCFHTIRRSKHLRATPSTWYRSCVWSIHEKDPGIIVLIASCHNISNSMTKLAPNQSLSNMMQTGAFPPSRRKLVEESDIRRDSEWIDSWRPSCLFDLLHTQLSHVMRIRENDMWRNSCMCPPWNMCYDIVFVECKRCDADSAKGNTSDIGLRT
jgi:hypothetical protein